jgi:hypothetical protein
LHWTATLAVKLLDRIDVLVAHVDAETKAEHLVDG